MTFHSGFCNEAAFFCRSFKDCNFRKKLMGDKSLGRKDYKTGQFKPVKIMLFFEDSSPL
jgi:hypothetical protein